MNGGRMTILMLTSERGWRGGETQIDLLMRGLMERGVGIALAAPPGSAIGERARESQITAYPLAIAGGFDPAAAFRLRRIVARGGFDIVHSHSSHAHGCAFLALCAFRARPRHVVSRRVAFTTAANLFSRLKYERGADHYLAISAAVRETLAAAGIAENRITIVPSGIDLEKFAPPGDPSTLRRELNLPATGPLVGSIGALVRNKAHADLVSAAQRLTQRVPAIHFLIIGEGPLRGKLESRARALGVADRIVFTGYREDSLALLSLCDCFVIPSLQEGLCTSIMDAQVLGIPVVASRTGGIPELITDGESGLLVTPRRPPQLAAAIERILTETGLRSACIRNGRAKAAEYDYRHMVERTIAAYRALPPR